MQLIDFILNIDTYLADFTQTYGVLVYLILFLIIFCETGLVIFPILPGDSVIFAAGALSPTTSLNIGVLWIVLVLAAILGDSLNFYIGSKLRNYIKNKPDSKIIKQKHLAKTEDFFQKHGAKSIVLARFVPIVRTFAPFVAGAGAMNYLKFIKYNIIGGISWISIFLGLGYFFGGLSIVQNHFELVIVLIIIISLIPIVIEKLKKG